MKNNTGETYPLIVVYHGNGDHEIYEAESNGWVTLAGGIRAIVVAPFDNYELGMPPESAAHRYGPENAAFIRDVICEKYPVDMSRIYAAGFSIGGFTVAETAAADPSLFAAAAAEAYPADGYMEIFPYNEYGGDADAAAYDLPFVYHAGTSDSGNSMPHPADSKKPRVLSAQLFFNQILTFNNMTDQLIDLEDFDYDLYPGEGDARRNWKTGEITGGYDWWDGTAAQYITQNLDFDAYPYYGYDFTAIPNTARATAQTPEGIEYTKNTWYNNEGNPMLLHMVMGDMGHNHYTRYAQIIWDEMFSKYSRDPETKALIYTGSTVAVSSESLTYGQAESVTLEATYKGTIPATSVRVRIDSGLDVIRVNSEYDFQYNPLNGKVVVYTDNTFKNGDVLFTIEVNTAEAKPGRYSIGLEYIDATDNEAESLAIGTIGGSVTIGALKGDVNMDGSIDNRDLILIARYLVDLVEFNAKAARACGLQRRRHGQQ
jgi:hypothetical protein